MRLTQGAFSYLPDFTDEEIRSQLDYCIKNNWAVSIEHTDDPHPRNTYWTMWGLPAFDVSDPVLLLKSINECRAAHPNQYIRVAAFDRRYQRQTTALDFIVNRPKIEPGFRLERQEVADRQVKYSLHSYATDLPAGGRYPSANGKPATDGHD